MLSDDIRYSHYIKHLEDGYFNSKEAWAIFFYIEASFRLTNDGQFNITKAYNLSDLLDVVLDDSVFYKKKLLDIGNGRMGTFRNKTWRI